MTMSETVPENFYITEDNFEQAHQAVRDILYLYHQAVTSCGGFGPDLNTGSFDPFFFLQAELKEPPGISFAWT